MLIHEIISSIWQYTDLNYTETYIPEITWFKEIPFDPVSVKHGLILLIIASLDLFAQPLIFFFIWIIIGIEKVAESSEVFLTLFF